MRPSHRSHCLPALPLGPSFSTESGLIRKIWLTMQSVDSGRLGDSPDYEAESSFPERHLDVEDKPPPFSGAGPDPYAPGSVTKRPLFEPPAPGMVSLHQQWPANHSPLLPHADRLRGHPLSAGSDYFSTSFPQSPIAAALTTPEWHALRHPSPGSLFWHTAPSDLAVDEELDLDSLHSPQSRRQSTIGPSKPSAAMPSPHHHPAAAPRHDRPYISDFDYSRLDPLDPAAAGMVDLVPHSGGAPAPGYASPAGFGSPLHTPTHPGNNASNANGAELDLSYPRDGSSASNKMDSKRIAHKLSEKSRRNRLTIAIREIQKLLPSEFGNDGGGGGGSGSGGGSTGGGGGSGRSPSPSFIRPGVPVSKLDVVEMAVGFIRDLKAKNKAISTRLRELEMELEKCQCRREREGEDVAGKGDVGSVAERSPSSSEERAAGG
ncbi:hypothetical protein VTJ49DRAFT_4049 [Mycothermus thermophilus]|uniref:BHLH domain-containing protein n=1 Tax=Humicola insolens TaxID=85995 RepID=A0ABR3V6G4_HUMIN